jgi:hypothetical protein
VGLQILTRKSTKFQEKTKEDGAGSGNFVPFFQGISNPRVLSDMGLAIANKEAFQNYLKVQKKSNFKQILCYAQKYADVLLTREASILMSLPSAQRRHVMEGLSALAKYAG